MRLRELRANILSGALCRSSAHARTGMHVHTHAHARTLSQPSSSVLPSHVSSVNSSFFINALLLLSAQSPPPCIIFFLPLVTVLLGRVLFLPLLRVSLNDAYGLGTDRKSLLKERLVLLSRLLPCRSEGTNVVPSRVWQERHFTFLGELGDSACYYKTPQREAMADYAGAQLRECLPGRQIRRRHWLSNMTLELRYDSILDTWRAAVQ